MKCIQRRNFVRCLQDSLITSKDEELRRNCTKQKNLCENPPVIWGAMYQEDGLPTPPLHNLNKSDKMCTN
jgi:hypothetical protein